MQFLQQQETKKAEAQTTQAQGSSPSRAQEAPAQEGQPQQAEGKLSGRSPTSAAIELTRLRTSNVPETMSTEAGTRMVSEDGRTLVTMRPVMTRGRGRPVTRFVSGPEAQGVRLAAPGQRLPLSRTTNVNLDSLRPGLEYTRSPYGVRFSSTPPTRLVQRPPYQIVRGSPTHHVQTTQAPVPIDHEYAQQPVAQEPAQTTAQEASEVPQQVPTPQQPAVQAQLPPQTQHFRVIDYSQSRSPPRPLTPGTRIVHLQPYSPPRQRISSSGLEDLAQVSQQMQSQVVQSGQHAVYPIPSKIL